ncbi:YcjF family protein [Periweissella ghanensis]|uniref:DUF697 domain-containing protein n=1 Tax=Periweissella ghanensis TaxID=467997 RepID=A0ABM8Z8Y9_9LACO|nr:DUF697 domain-containing protein [Periweissella ghanensis]MCM0600955.1 DUF697 domain-containing protein [Periweissella ghanensis]CAH0417627.1 hypothetical protein WGH24286_00039 [Periweissella ghanensis]
MQEIKNVIAPVNNKHGIKNQQALLTIRGAAVAAAGIAVSPIPFTDATLLIPGQTAMIIELYRLYDRSIAEGAIKGILSSLATTTVARTVVGNLFKFIPGIGTVTGGAINGTVAYAFTNSMGLAVAKALENGELDTPGDLKDVILAAFNFRQAGRSRKQK